MSYYRTEHAIISEFIGKTFTKIEGGVQDSELKFYCEDGYVYTMYHNQDCCETVYVEDIIGDLQDLVGSPIYSAEEVSQHNPYAYESGTWTFYRMKSNRWDRDTIVIRWNGESNGYYSESVDIRKEKIQDVL